MGLMRQQNVWKCDHCGKEGVWGKGWRSKLVLHKSGGPGPWDEQLVACSQECQDAIDQKQRWRGRRRSDDGTKLWADFMLGHDA